MSPDIPTSPAHPLRQGEGQCILYLDDEEALVMLVSRLLRRRHYRVKGYTEAADALAEFRADPGQFDLVITDHNMPGMSGMQFAAEVLAVRPDLPVVLTSGYVDDDLQAQARSVGVTHVVPKPSSIEELCLAVDRFLRKD